MKYRAFYQNGGYAAFEWDGDPSSEEERDDLLQTAYDAAPPGLCYQCAGNYDISDDVEVYEINEIDSGKTVFSEPSWDERLRNRVTDISAQLSKANKDLEEVMAERNRLHRALLDAGFTVDRDTYVVSR